jgi:choline dehydrogenase-like flavoprotein
VLCGGAVNSPQLLMLSGIGDREQLARHGIDVVADAPEVGRNLMDHLAVPVGFDVPDDSLQGAEKPLEMVNYLLRRRGCSHRTSARRMASCAAGPNSTCPISS